MKIQKKIMFLVLTVIMIFTVFSLQKGIDSLSADSLDIEFYYLPHGKTLKSFSLGYAPLIADIFWIKGILYFGKHISDEDDFPFLLKTLESKPAGLSTADREDIRKQKERYKYLYDFVNIVTDMDPYFRYPYIFGGMFLSMKYGEADKAIEICKLAVSTGAYPMYEVENGVYKITRKPAELKPVMEYLKLQGRFRHLPQEELDAIQAEVTKKWKILLKKEQFTQELSEL